jgi:hypothetical protein
MEQKGDGDHSLRASRRFQGSSELRETTSLGHEPRTEILAVYTEACERGTGVVNTLAIHVGLTELNSQGPASSNNPPQYTVKQWNRRRQTWTKKKNVMKTLRAL